MKSRFRNMLVFLLQNICYEATSSSARQKNNAGDGTWTHTILLPQAPEACASANSATPAFLIFAALRDCLIIIPHFYIKVNTFFRFFYFFLHLFASAQKSISFKQQKVYLLLLIVLSLPFVYILFSVYVPVNMSDLISSLCMLNMYPLFFQLTKP